MKIVITGGHLSPALSVIEKLDTDVKVVFIGRKHVFENDDTVSLEYQEITKRNIPFYDLKTGRLKRQISKEAFHSITKIPGGLVHALSILKKEKPDYILSFGGYLGLPVVIAGSFLSIPSVIHEQTFSVGLSNKLASKFAKVICISWEESRKHFGNRKTVLTGNPLRSAFFDALSEKKKEYSKPLLYITGGSAGSHEVNDLIAKHVSELLDDFVVVHQTGDSEEYRDYAVLSEIRKKLPNTLQSNYHLFKFTTAQEAAAYMRDATLVISRSGVNTITELLYLKKKAYLVPLRYGQKGEQITNATVLKRAGLAEIHTSESSFLSTVRDMTSKKYTLVEDAPVVYKDAPERIIHTITNGTK